MSTSFALSADELHRLLDTGLSRARRELELGPQDGMAEAELSVALKYALAELLAARFGGVSALRRQARAGALPADLRDAAGAGMDALLNAARSAGHAAWATHLERPALRARVAHLAIDALLSERLAPEIILAPGCRALSPHPPVHALIFSAFTHCAHELYPLLVDALTARLSDPGGQAFRAVGVHESWLRDGALCRVLLLDAEVNRLLEVDLDPPLAPATAQVLALDLTREADSHRAIEAALPGTAFTNPLSGARRLDDKAWTTETWRAAGLAAPAYLAFPRGAGDAVMRDALAGWLAAHGPHLVVKPADGTEGRGVELIDFARPEGRARCFAALARLAAAGPVLVMAEHGVLRCLDDTGPVRCTVRLNVCWDGRGAWAESGYAQIAADAAGIASAGRGGRVLPLYELWRRLCLPDGTLFAPTREDWQRLTDAAETGIAALARSLGPAMPRLVGVDLLLDQNTFGELIPVLLEANPRPAGMSHACFLTGDGPTGEPGVTQRLWAALE